ncbi:MAG: NifU family protein [Bacteroidota bacterium]|nr:NifU family protein [Bacteroidota bacterium]
MESKEKSLVERIEEALNFCRPYLQADGGDVEFVNVSDDGIVNLRYLGVCKNCPLSLLTLRAGIERSVLKNAPEVKRVELVV